LGDIVDCLRAEKQAKAAWAHYQEQCPGVPRSSDFGAGFESGYADYLYAGGTGNPPPVPPRCYWKSKYETPKGHCAIEDWFAGFREGATDARLSGARQYVTLPLPAISTPAAPPPTLEPPHPPALVLPPARGVQPAEALPAPRSAPNTPPPPVSMIPAALPEAVLQVENKDRLLDILTSSIYPSERECAAETLLQQEESVQMDVVEALATAAQTDPAATVRAACVRVLVPLRSHSPRVAAVMHELQTDPDPRVRRELEAVEQ
jgi:hypothetical protein